MSSAERPQHAPFELRRAFDEPLKIVKAVGVLARERQIPGRLAEPTLHRGEVAGLIAGVAPQRVGL